MLVAVISILPLTLNTSDIQQNNNSRREQNIDNINTPFFELTSAGNYTLNTAKYDSSLSLKPPCDG